MNQLLDLGILLAKSAGPDVMIEQLKEAIDSYTITKNEDDKRKVQFFCMLTIAACSEGTIEEFVDDIKVANDATNVAETLSGKRIKPQ